MNHERWEQHLQERIRDLENHERELRRQLAAAHIGAAKQKARAELWRHRALTYSRRRP